MQFYRCTHGSLDVVFGLINSLNSMHLTVSEIEVIIHLNVFMAYPFIPKYLTSVKN